MKASIKNTTHKESLTISTILEDNDNVKIEINNNCKELETSLTLFEIMTAGYFDFILKYIDPNVRGSLSHEFIEHIESRLLEVVNQMNNDDQNLSETEFDDDEDACDNPIAFQDIEVNGDDSPVAYVDEDEDGFRRIVIS